MNENKQLMTTEEVADWLKVNKITVYRWRERGLPVVRLGRHYRYEPNKVWDWLTKYVEKQQNND